ncbi:probable JmjC domain-containing histone demethylation protein 2C isoform X3 [Mya arenaria]|uniref:probable JmjC domain-containing histone demethylation protein 2C isoform X3 n=1 Tax=Mya arenaria TaxID=6604 RepID=UPI0022E304B6|nr:probable JmjC domain-containing histone demethylation protein 2C isoform X3 [Mya arenaria]
MYGGLVYPEYYYVGQDDLPTSGLIYHTHCITGSDVSRSILGTRAYHGNGISGFSQAGMLPQNFIPCRQMDTNVWRHARNSFYGSPQASQAVLFDLEGEGQCFSTPSPGVGHFSNQPLSVWERDVSGFPDKPHNVVDSILRGVEIGGIAPRRRPRAVKEKETQNTTSRASANNSTPQTSTRSSVLKKPRSSQQAVSTVTSTPPTVVTAVPSPLPTEQKVSEKARPTSRRKPRVVEISGVKAKPLSLNRRESPSPAVDNDTATLSLRVSPRSTPTKERTRPHRSRERDKLAANSGVLEPDIEDTGGGGGTVDKSAADSLRNRNRSQQRREEKLSTPSGTSKAQSRIQNESPRDESGSPRRRSLSRTRVSVQKEAEAVIKSNLSGSKKDKPVEDKVSAKSETSDTKTEKPERVKKVEKPSTSLTDSANTKLKSGSDKSETQDNINDRVEQKLKEIKSAYKKKEKESGITKGEPKEKRSRNVKSNGEKETKKREKKKDNVVTTKETQNNGKKSVGSKSVDVKETVNELGDNNMHFIKKKQLAGASLTETPQNSGISTQNLDLNQSVTDQLARAEKLTSLNGDDKLSSTSSSLLSPVSNSSEPELVAGSRDFKSNTTSGVSSHSTNSSSVYSQEERSQSRSSDSRCSSGLSGDEARRPGSRVDDLKSVKSSPASSPLIVDKSEPLQIYRDPELMSKNPVRSNVPSMHNSHKSSYPALHQPVPTQASRPSSVGMTSTPLSSGLERQSRTPVIPSVAYPMSALGASLPPGASLSSLMPPGLHQLDPATLALHQQFVQQQHLAAALSQQYNSALSMSYPPRGTGSLTKAQLEHLWQQKYPSLPVPPPWLLAKQHDELVGSMRLLHEQEQLERERMERERSMHEREQRERKERERRDRERMEKERMDRERREREKIEAERAAERERAERDKQEKERLERERLERERSRILKESAVDPQSAVDQHFDKSLRQASQRNWKSLSNQGPQSGMQDGYQYTSNTNYRPKYTAAQTGMWPQPSITLGTGKPKTEHPSPHHPAHPSPQHLATIQGDIQPEQKIKQEQQLETDGKIAEMMRRQEEMVHRKHKELMYQQEEFIKQQQQRYHRRGDEKPDIKHDVKPSVYPGHIQPKVEPGNVAGIKQEVGTASFSLYGYQPEKFSYISADQLQSYEHSKLGRSQSPKKGLSVPPPLIKDTKPHSSVIVENKRETVKSSSPHGGHYPPSHMSPHPQPKPAHTPERSMDRPRSSNSSPGSHGMSPALAHQHNLIRGDPSRQPTSRSQSPLRIASPQQLSAAVMQPMDYRCSPNVNKNRGSPGSNTSPHHSSSNSAAFSPAIAQPPVSLPHSVSYTYGLITQGLVPNPIYSTNSKNPAESQRTVSVTGTAQVPRAAQSPSFSPQGQTGGTKRKGQKEGATRKRQKGGDNQSQSSNNPLNLTVPNTTPQIVSNPSPYTTSSGNTPSSAMHVSQANPGTATTVTQVVNHRLGGLTGFMDSFKSFVENTVQNAFMSDPDLAKKDGQMKKPTPEQLKELEQQFVAQKGQPYKPKSSLERSSTPVTAQQANTSQEGAANLPHNASSSNLFLADTRPANGQVDTDSDTLSAPSPPPHLKQDGNNTTQNKPAAKHPNLKKAWLQRHSEDDKNVTKPGNPLLATPNSNPVMSDGSSGSPTGEDKDNVKTCYVNCSYISPSKDGGSKSPISSLQGAVPNGPTEGKETPPALPPAPTNDGESTTSASEAETTQNPDGGPNGRKRVKNKKEKAVNPKKAKLDQPTEEVSVNSTAIGKKKTNRRSKDAAKNKVTNDNMSEEQIKKIVEHCKETVKEKESKPTEEAYDKKYDFESGSEQKSDNPVDMETSPAEEPQENESTKKNEKKERKKNKEKKEKKTKKDKQLKEKKGEKVVDKMEEDIVETIENVYQPPPSILKETEMKAQQATFSKPLVKLSDADLRKTCEPFLQDGSCSEVTPKLMKCRECRMTPTQRGKTVPNIFCRFYAFRRLKYSQRGFVTIDGFSELSDAEQDDIDPWIPKSPIIEPKIDVDMARFIINRIGDNFCELVQQERDAQICAGDNAKIAWKRAVTGVREMCDVCDTTLFNMHWVCRKCGFVVCLDCYKVKSQSGEESDSDSDSDVGSHGSGGGEEEKRKWLTCSANRQPHNVDKLMLTQIIPSDALWEVGRLVHEVRDKWGMAKTCPCSPKVNAKKNGIKNEISEAIKHLSPKKKLVNGVNNEEEKGKTKNGNIKNSVYNPDNTSPLSLLADVASMDSEKTRDRSESPLLNKKGDGKNGKSYNPITEPVSPGSSEKKLPSSCSTLRELLTKTAGGKVKNNSETNKKKSKNVNSSLNDIIKNVVEKKTPKDYEKAGEILAGTECEKPMKLLHYTPKVSSHMLVRETPIIVHNLTETSVIYADVPHSWLCDGRLLRLHDSRHRGNQKIFMEQWRRGQPVLVSGVDKYINHDLWKPAFYTKHFGEVENDLINCRTSCLVVGHPMKHFWDGFGCVEERLVDENGTPMLLKLKDWPPGDDFSDVLPQQFADLMQALPLPEYTRRDGKLNLVARLPDFLVKPDLGPKMYIAYGSAQHPQEGTTNLHLDVSDATNVMVHVGYLDEEERGFVEKDAETIKAMEMAQCDPITKRRIREVRETPGALWHIFDAVDADKIRDFLNKVAKERGEEIEQHHDPIHDQSWYLDEELRERLACEYGVLGYTILQCLGDAIFIPAGAPHQVRNLNNCIKVAEDFVSPENIHHCFQLTQEFRDLSSGHSNHEDKLQIKNIVYHAVKDSSAVLMEAEPEDYED